MSHIQTHPELRAPQPVWNHDRASEPPRSDILRRRWWLVLIIALVIGGATYVVSKKVPAQFRSTATVSVQVTGAADPNESATAANSVASQYAQIVTGGTVLQAAAKTLSPGDVSGLSGAVSGGTVADQNIVQVRATGASPGQAQRRATAVVNALRLYVTRVSSNASSAYSRTARRQLKPIDTQISSISAKISAASRDTLASGRYLALQQTLSTLIAQRSSAESAIAQNATAGQPSMNLLSAAGAGAQVAPKPTLYAAVAFVLALVLVSQAMIYLAPRPRSVARTGAVSPHA
jgi:capsular polysaccharide biosynthesis protein